MIEKKFKGENLSEIDKMTFKGGRLLEIDNLHIAECGSLPSLDAADKYVSYFEGGCGDQWLFIGDRKTGNAVIRGGDAGWPTKYIVSRIKPCPVNLVLGEEEKQWIIACFMAMCDADHEAVSADFAAGDVPAAAMEMLTKLSQGPTAPAAEDHENNGADGNHRPKENPEE